MDSPLLFPTRIGMRVSASNAHWTVTVLKGYFKKLISPFLTKLTLFPPSYLIKIPLFILINANQSTVSCEILPPQVVLASGRTYPLRLEREWALIRVIS